MKMVPTTMSIYTLNYNLLILNSQVNIINYEGRPLYKLNISKFLP